MLEKAIKKIRIIIFKIYLRLLRMEHYGQLPNKVLRYEKLYDRATSGWYDIDAKAMSYGSVELEVGRFYYAFVQMVQPKIVL